jgi:hypothetical protein
LEPGQLRLAEVVVTLDDEVEELGGWTVDRVDEVAEFCAKLKLDAEAVEIESTLFVELDGGGRGEDDPTSLIGLDDSIDDGGVEDEAGRLDDRIELELVEERLKLEEKAPTVPISLPPLAAALKLTAPWHDFS